MFMWYCLIVRLAIIMQMNRSTVVMPLSQSNWYLNRCLLISRFLLCNKSVFEEAPKAWHTSIKWCSGQFAITGLCHAMAHGCNLVQFSNMHKFNVKQFNLNYTLYNWANLWWSGYPMKDGLVHMNELRWNEMYQARCKS